MLNFVCVNIGELCDYPEYSRTVAMFTCILRAFWSNRVRNRCWLLITSISTFSASFPNMVHFSLWCSSSAAIVRISLVEHNTTFLRGAFKGLQAICAGYPIPIHTTLFFTTVRAIKWQLTTYTHTTPCIHRTNIKQKSDTNYMRESLINKLRHRTHKVARKSWWKLWNFFWENDLQTYETKIELSGNARCRSWRKKGIAHQHQNMIQAVKHGEHSSMVWVCFSASGPGQIPIIEGKKKFKTVSRNFTGECQGSCPSSEAQYKLADVFQNGQARVQTCGMTCKSAFQGIPEILMRRGQFP